MKISGVRFLLCERSIDFNQSSSRFAYLGSISVVCVRVIRRRFDFALAGAVPILVEAALSNSVIIWRRCSGFIELSRSGNFPITRRENCGKFSAGPGEQRETLRASSRAGIRATNFNLPSPTWIISVTRIARINFAALAEKFPDSRKYISRITRLGFLPRTASSTDLPRTFPFRFFFRLSLFFSFFLFFNPSSVSFRFENLRRVYSTRAEQVHLL